MTFLFYYYFYSRNVVLACCKTEFLIWKISKEMNVTIFVSSWSIAEFSANINTTKYKANSESH